MGPNVLGDATSINFVNGTHAIKAVGEKGFITALYNIRG